jgi:hypothetical protein
MPHAGYAAYLRATAYEGAPTRTLVEWRNPDEHDEPSEWQKAKEIGEWARRERAADGQGRAAEDEGDEGDEDDPESDDPGSRPGTGRA